MRSQNEGSKKEHGVGTLAVYAAAVLFIILGIAFLAIPELEVRHLCYLLAICLILIGVLRIAEYFIRESYRNINQYGFSMGLLAIILGVCMIIRIQQFVSIFNLCLGIGVLLTAVVKLQNAMDLRALNAKGFLVFLLFSVAMVICGAVILINPFETEAARDQFTYIIMIVDGVLSVISTTYLMILTKRTAKQTDSETAGRQEPDAPKALPGESDDDELL